MIYPTKNSSNKFEDIAKPLITSLVVDMFHSKRISSMFQLYGEYKVPLTNKDQSQVNF